MGRRAESFVVVKARRYCTDRVQIGGGARVILLTFAPTILKR